MNKYSFIQKTEISKRIARPEKINEYRSLLKSHRPKAASKLRASAAATAQSLVYELLDFYTEEEIVSITSISAGSLASRVLPPLQSAQSSAVKKKPLKSRNIRELTGRILTTLWSALLTAYTRTASTVTAVWQKLKETLLELQVWMQSSSRR